MTDDTEYPEILRVNTRARVIAKAKRMALARAVFDFLVSFKADHDGNSPSIREIGKAVDNGSTSEIWRALLDLQDAGKVYLPEPGKSRYIFIVGGCWSLAVTARAMKRQGRGAAR